MQTKEKDSVGYYNLPCNCGEGDENGPNCVPHKTWCSKITGDTSSKAAATTEFGYDAEEAWLGHPRGQP